MPDKNIERKPRSGRRHYAQRIGNNGAKNQAQAQRFVTTGSGENIFAVLGLPDANDRLVKVDLAIAIKRILDEKGWTQTEAAERTQVTQPQISNIRRAKVDSFSIVALQNILRNLGVDVEIHLHRREGGGIGTLKVMQSA